MVRLPRRTLADWTPDAGDVDAWLARWAEAGWKPEHPWGGTDTAVNGIAGSAFPEADPDLVRTALGSTPSSFPKSHQSGSAKPTGAHRPDLL